MARCAIPGASFRTNRLIEKDGYYTMDFDDLETAFRGGARAMILCSPHNPIGRVWNRDEIDGVVALCRKYDVLLIADEIHAGFIFKGQKQNSIMNYDYDNAIVMISASKAFNLAGLGMSNIIVRRADDVKRINERSHAAGASGGDDDVFRPDSSAHRV